MLQFTGETVSVCDCTIDSNALHLASCVLTVKPVKLLYSAILVVLCRIHQDGVNIANHDCLLYVSNIMKKMF